MNKKEDAKLPVRIRYWYQETIESGRFVVTGIMALHTAKYVIEAGAYERAEIVLDEEDWPVYTDHE